MDKYQYLHNLLSRLNLQKSHVFLTWNPYKANCISDTSKYQEFENNVRNEFTECSFFDSQLDNIYPGNYFLVNDFTHLSVFGAEKRIKRWCNTLPL